MSFFNTILNILLPIKCISCGKKKEADLCIECLSNSAPAERETASWIFPLYDYRHLPVKKSLWLLKYKRKKRLAEIFAEVIYDKILEELSDLSVLENFNNIILIPIPLSRKRIRERGYNQAELICRELININNLREKNISNKQFFKNKLDLKLENNILIKIKEGKQQALIENRKERLENILGSFSVKDEKENAKIKNKNIILIDDITTTGATLNEARKILKGAGAKKIIAFTVAH